MKKTKLISDKEINEAATKFNPLQKLDGEFLRAAFKAGAKWAIDQYDKEKK